MVSASGSFALRFFTPGNSTFTYLGIWYNTIPEQTVVWVANGESPIPQNCTAVFTIGVGGNFVILDAKGKLIWSSNVSSTPGLASNSTAGALLENENLVLMRRGTSSEDPRPGNFSFGIDREGHPPCYIWKQNSISYRFEYNNEYSGGNMLGVALYTSVVSGNSGAPGTLCDFYAHCGPFDSCEIRYSGLCRCLTGFEPRFSKDWANGKWNGGCARKVALGCDSSDVFLKHESMKVPDHTIFFGEMSIKDCETECIRNSSCTANAYSNSTCLIWIGDLLDLGHSSSTARPLHVRVRGCEPSIFTSILINSTNESLRLWSSKPILFTFHLLDAVTVGGSGNSAQRHKIFIATIASAISSILVLTGFLAEFGDTAIKRLSRRSSQGLEEFMNELKLIAKLQHKNLVSLLGFCVEGEEKILIYEYMPNCSLDKFLFGYTHYYCLCENHNFVFLISLG
ncbi:G-type lectin S-receptor-like serine/threonine-protein kinase SD1-13 [Lycium ferocissimum]|uniref:G-type lectin S-receptor-like serine/threonine-protein kinase SD1-13 n=1 Tax=Lycium ferocissimum TaxID=112874 RepID=UPI002815D4E6|nr:G-type lectin S-receptor-like serine/threonine-protein kinase SD1-13 [Lycium ferocissimum]